MTADHHDADLCRRLAVKFKLGERVHYKPEDPLSGFYEGPDGQELDFCCNYAHGGMLEQKMAKLGWSYTWENCPGDPESVAVFRKEIPGDGVIGTHRLHTTALAAWEVVKDKCSCSNPMGFHLKDCVFFAIDAAIGEPT